MITLKSRLIFLIGQGCVRNWNKHSTKKGFHLYTQAHSNATIFMPEPLFHLLLRLSTRKTHRKLFLTYQTLSLHLLHLKEISASPRYKVLIQMNDTILLCSHRSCWGKNSKKYKFHSPLPQPDLFWHCLQQRHKNPSESRLLSVV